MADAGGRGGGAGAAPEDARGKAQLVGRARGQTNKGWGCARAARPGLL
jgi:hypothetical protein